ncbi:MAG: phage tail sheath subtilisin-like domain-containing protein, partial [Neisseria sp.]|nr:phage tail sheath subtilisin-like domain-containing protein [Neisseria sp.]
DKNTIKTWINSMRDDEGIKIQGVFANLEADCEAIINEVQGVTLSDATELTAEQVTAYVAGITAGASINKSNTGLKYEGAIDVTPRMTKTEMETAIKEGKYIFKVDSAQNVTTLYDINSLTTVGENKNNSFKKNRTIRTLDGINNDTVNIFESNYIGNINNNADGRSLLRSAYIEYFNLIQNLNAIQNFTAEDVEVLEGKEKEALEQMNKLTAALEQFHQSAAALDIKDPEIKAVMDRTLQVSSAANNLMIYAGKYSSELTIDGKDKDSLKFAKDFQDKSQKLQETLRAANQEVEKAATALGKKYSQ